MEFFTEVTLRIDTEVLNWIKGRSEKLEVEYEALINLELRRFYEKYKMELKVDSTLDDLGETLKGGMGMQIWRPSTDSNVFTTEDREIFGSLTPRDFQITKHILTIEDPVSKQITIKGLEGNVVSGIILGFTLPVTESDGMAGRGIYFETKPGFYGFIDAFLNGANIISIS